MPTIPTQVYDMVGQEFDRRRGVVSTQEFQRWAAAVGDLNPLYFDTDFAQAHGYRDVIMPPLYVGHVMSGVRMLSELRPDGSPLTLGGLALPIAHDRRMAAGDSLDDIRPVYGGDELTAVTRLAAVSTKSGTSSTFVLVQWGTRYSNQDGVLVSDLTSGVILT